MNNVISSNNTSDITNLILVIIALVALLSPSLTAIINNCHDTKIRKLEIENRNMQDNILYKRSIIHNYLSSVGKCVMCFTNENLKEYGEYFPKAYTLITDDKTKQKMLEINQCIGEVSDKIIKTELEKLLPMIEKEIYCK